MSESNDIPTSKGNKRGPKPKQLTEKVILGLPVGRDKKIVPPEEVYKLAALGCKNIEIAEWFGVTEDAISRNFAAELEKGRAAVKISLRRAMLNNACSNHNAAVQIFLAKNMLGMSSDPIDTDANAPLPWQDDDI
jgi:hypothetical protein